MQPTVENLLKMMETLQEDQIDRLDSDQKEAFAQLLNYLLPDFEEFK